MPQQRIYLDHAATSPLRPEARAAMEDGFALWANPSSPHAEGRKAKQALEDARERIKRTLGWDGELIFTSGASEALWIALNRSKMKRRIVSAVEHDAVFRAAPDAEIAPIRVSHERLEVAVDLSDESQSAVVAIQDINPETGFSVLGSSRGATPSAVDYWGRIKKVGSLLLVDCSQSAGKWDLPDADMLVVSAHKFGGPIGIGALLVKDFAMLEPLGGHERGYRQGTENLPAVLGMAAALEVGGLENWAVTTDQMLEFKNALWAHGEIIVPQTEPFSVNPLIMAIAHPTMSAQALLIRLDAMGFAVSAGSACSSGTLKKSRVLDAFGVSDEVAARTIRVSIGWSTTADELEQFAAAWADLT